MSLSVARLLLSAASREEHLLGRGSEYSNGLWTAQRHRPLSSPSAQAARVPQTCIVSAAAALTASSSPADSLSLCSFLVSHSHSSLVVPWSFAGFPSNQLPLSVSALDSVSLSLSLSLSLSFSSLVCSPNHRITTLLSRCHHASTTSSSIFLPS